MSDALQGKIAIVAGATRGAGRGIAAMLGEAGATVYCTGRSVRGTPASGDHRPETIEESAELVTEYGGQGIPVQVDHRDAAQVEALIARVEGEQGRLDILVNDIWGSDRYFTFGGPFWEEPTTHLLPVVETALLTHIITAKAAAPLFVRQGHGILFEITDGLGVDYRGNLIYDIVKQSVNRLAFGLAQELGPHGVTALGVTPGFLRSEEMLDTYMGVTEENWFEGARKEPHFIASETPFFVGRAVAALAADPALPARAGTVVASWDLAEEYGFDDIDGRRPHWGRHHQRHVVGGEPMDVEARIAEERAARNRRRTT
jgi:NAD(P)-dependent dehydrogenase (short-subunit alcohol dehydrogenase family)